MKILAAINLVLASSMFAQTPSSAPQKHPFTFEDMMKLKRVGAPVPSPDGKWVVFDCEDVDLAANKKTSHLWIVPASGGESRRLNPTTESRGAAAVFSRRQAFDLDLESDRSDADLDVRFRSRSGRAGWQAASSHERSPLAPMARFGRRTGRTSCSCQRFIPIAKMMRATNSATKS